MTVREGQDRSGTAWRLRRIGTVAGIVVAWYLSVLLVVNLIDSPATQGSIASQAATALFPRLGTGGAKVDQSSVQTEWSIIQSNYLYRDVPGSVGTSGAEQGIAQQLETTYNDHFTLFLTQAENDSLNQQLNGTLTGGVGVEVAPGCDGASPCPAGATPNDVVIVAVLRNQPADKAGVKNGDIMESVDGKPIPAFGSNPNDQITQITNQVKGKPGTTVTLGLQRHGAPLTVTITRQNLNIPSVYTQKFGTTLYIQISGFDSGTADDLRSALQQNLPGVTAIVLDLRGNGGGLLDAAQSVASEFLSSGTVVTQRGRMDQSRQPSTAQVVKPYPVTSGGLATSPAIKVFVLTDGGTASASEIVTMALHDEHRATVVGAKTFGKGTVQETFALPDGNFLHLTIAKWFGPDNESIDGTGITPDVPVSLGTGARFELDVQSPGADGDPQLQEALRLAAGG